MDKRELDKIVDAALERLDERAAQQSPTFESPTRTVWYVRSDHTGAAASEHDNEPSAHEHCDALNDECRRDGIKHLGERMAYHVSGPAEVIDELANAELAIESLRDNLKAFTGDDKERGERELERRLAELDELKRAQDA